jgi:hypothetical protein
MYQIFLDINSDPRFTLSALQASYNGEEGQDQGIRAAVLRNLETRLRLTLEAANDFKTRTTGPNSHAAVAWDPNTGNKGAAPKVGPGQAPTGGVKNMVKFWEQKIDNQGQVDRLNKEVIRVRQWIFRQGGKLTPGGKIVWPKSGRVVQYDHDLVRQGLTGIVLQAGRLFNSDGTPFDTSKMVTVFSGPGYAIYVMSQEGNLHVSSHAAGYRHHSSLLAGAHVAGAGELQASNGNLRFVSNKSGHYCPDVFNLLKVLAVLSGNGIPPNFRVRTHIGPTGDEITNYANVDAFMRSNSFDDQSYEVAKRVASGNSGSYTPYDYSNSNAAPIDPNAPLPLWRYGYNGERIYF